MSMNADISQKCNSIVIYFASIFFNYFISKNDFTSKSVNLVSSIHYFKEKVLVVTVLAVTMFAITLFAITMFVVKVAKLDSN